MESNWTAVGGMELSVDRGSFFLFSQITLLTLKEYTENKQEELTRVNKNVLFVGAF